MLEKNILQSNAFTFLSSVEKNLEYLSKERTEGVTIRLKKVLDAFSQQGLGPHHFSSVNGYGHGDLGRDLIDKVFANIFKADHAAARVQFVSGTHAIASVLFGILRPGDNLLSVTGRPYETLEEVIGLRNSGQGSLKDFGINYEETSVFHKRVLQLEELKESLKIKRNMIFIQRSCGYSWRPSLSIANIKSICACIHEIQPECICFVDNCYGEFVEDKEPIEVGADLIAGSLIKNPGGTIVPAGGYIAGNFDLVEKACCRLTAPGIGSFGGTSFDLNRIILQGLFLSPQMVAESLIGSDLIAAVFNTLGFDVNPLPGEYRSDLIQAICLKKPEIIKILCNAFQMSSPVGSYLKPISSNMPGYQSDLLMAGGTFIDGSTSEFSADGPLKAPYNIFIQGGTHRSHIKIALAQALVMLEQERLLKLPQNI